MEGWLFLLIIEPFFVPSKYLDTCEKLFDSNYEWIELIRENYKSNKSPSGTGFIVRLLDISSYSN